MSSATRGAVWIGLVGRGCARWPIDEVPELRCDLLGKAVIDRAGGSDNQALRRVPRVEVVEERLTIGRADRFLGADDVPAERLVAEQQVVVHAVDVVARRVDVHVQLFDDHALLALDLLGVELRAQELVGENIQRQLTMLGGAFDVVAGVLLAGEGVEFPADAVDLRRDVLGGRSFVRALEEHVLGEVRDSTGWLGLIATACGDHHHHRD